MGIQHFPENGYVIIPEIYTEAECRAIGAMIESYAPPSPEKEGVTIYAIRALLKVLPELNPLIWNARLKALLKSNQLNYKTITKSLYFDKQEGANWFVAWHQDISINVAKRANVDGYHQWTQKRGIIGVVPPIEILQNTLTLRIHLDDTDESNGALSILKGSHREGIIRKEKEGLELENEVLCKVPRGGIMLMRPLTMHASKRALLEDGQLARRRRVIHLELCEMALDAPLVWAEHFSIR